MKILLAVGLAAVLTLGSCTAMFFGIKNTCVAHEKGINFQYEKNQAALAGYTNKIMDLVQVPAMAKNQIKEIAVAAIQGRYGQEGSKALFQAIVEQNPNVDPGLYRQIMQEMSAGRNSFDADQTTILDKCRVYDTYVESAPQSFFVGMAGHPSSNFDRTTMCKPVITEQTAQDFKTKRTGPLQINTQ